MYTTQRDYAMKYTPPPPGPAVIKNLIYIIIPKSVKCKYLEFSDINDCKENLLIVECLWSLRAGYFLLHLPNCLFGFI